LWYCNICNKDGRAGVMRHCKVCTEFDICEACFNLTSTLSAFHPHPLAADPQEILYPQLTHWVCNICHNDRRRRDQLMHCSTCEENFDVCEACFNQQPVKSPHHQHLLVESNLFKAYKKRFNSWVCDNCNERGITMYHCYLCPEYDECYKCAVGKPEQIRTRHHEHKLEETSPMVPYRQHNGEWGCDLCSRQGQGKMYHCKTCGDYDLCVTCAGK